MGVFGACNEPSQLKQSSRLDSTIVELEQKIKLNILMSLNWAIYNSTCLVHNSIMCERVCIYNTSKIKMKECEYEYTLKIGYTMLS